MSGMSAVTAMTAMTIDSARCGHRAVTHRHRALTDASTRGHLAA